MVKGDKKMARTIIDYQASRRWAELWSPLPFTNNLQIWSSLSAFGLAIFALFYNFVWGWLKMCGIELPNLYAVSLTPTTSVAGYVVLGLIGLGGLFVFVFCFGSLIYLIVRALKHEKIVVDPDNIPERIKAGMSKDELSKLEGKENGKRKSKPK